MWDKPDVLNAIASLLFAAAFLLAAYGSVLYVVRLPAFPLREVRVNGVIAHVTLEQVEIIARREIRGNFFTLDLAEARAAFEKLPWVRKVNARRQWPDRLEVALEEHVPLARWGSAALVNTHGEVFTAAYDGAPADGRESGALPQFIGPPGSAREIALRYGHFQRSLAAIGQAPVQVQMSPRRAWQVRLESGLTLELGREHIESRFDRFIAVYDRTVNRLQRKLDYVDLRYPNGFAVRIPELRDEPQEQRRGGKAARPAG
jgi:cell division protein FtsQ